jgi:nitroreductase
MTDLQSLELLKRGTASAGVEELILRRWSPRAFADREVSAADLKLIFEAAGWAASSFNEQPWRFLVGRKDDETYRKILGSLIEFNQLWAKSAPVLILSIASTVFTGNGRPNGSAMHDLGASTACLGIQAIALGLHTHSMAGFDKQKAREEFAVPDDFDIGVVTALGYLGDPSTLPDKMQAQELAPRTRKPLTETVLKGWGTPFDL